MNKSVYSPLCVLCAFVCEISIQSTSKKTCHLYQTSVSFMPCCIKHTVGGEGGGFGSRWDVLGVDKIEKGGR